MYDDNLIEIIDGCIRLKNYYFPFLTSKTVRLDQIMRIDLYKPSGRTGSWRLWGTGDFRTWFPLDISRPKRDLIFIMTLRRKWIRVGFTVENSDRVQMILREKGLIER